MIWLDNSRIIAVFAVIVLHVAGGFVNNSGVGSEGWWVGNICDSAVRWCVPVFVMISGALLLDPMKKENLGEFYRKRASRIFIPLLSWSVFYLLWTYLKGRVKGSTPSGASLFMSVAQGKPYYHMWFLYMILGLYAMTPFIRKVIIYSSRSELRLFLCLSFGLSFFNTLYLGQSKLFINWFLSYVPYYVLGYFIRTSGAPVPRIYFLLAYILSLVATSLGCYFLSGMKGLESGLYFYSYMSVTVIPMSICMMHLLKTVKRPIVDEFFTKKVAELTLGVYLIHPIILEALNVVGLHRDSFPPLFSIPMISALAFGVSLLGAWIIHKIPYARRTI